MIAQVLLQYYLLLRETDNIEVRHLLLDLENAITNAGLTEAEKEVIHITYLSPAPPPTRDNRRGRPRGGKTQSITVSKLNHILAAEPRRRHYPIRKETEYNAVERSKYWYRIILRRALSKINDALNYEELNYDLSTTPLWGVPKAYT